MKCLLNNNGEKIDEGLTYSGAAEINVLRSPINDHFPFVARLEDCARPPTWKFWTIDVYRRLGVVIDLYGERVMLYEYYRTETVKV